MKRGLQVGRIPHARHILPLQTFLGATHLPPMDLSSLLQLLECSRLPIPGFLLQSGVMLEIFFFSVGILPQGDSPAPRWGLSEVMCGTIFDGKVANGVMAIVPEDVCRKFVVFAAWKDDNDIGTLHRV
jgi:hypothetical protein